MKKGHVCLYCDDLEAFRQWAEQSGIPYSLDTRLSVPRVFLNDPWGNRMEIVQGRHESIHAG